ncbi:putative secreted protein [Minicystis rosea]|nr:putative secreted protein [Minicystis rosea]
MSRLRILTLNIWNRQGPWEQRVKLIRAGIRALAPDVVGLQEVLERDGQSQAHEIAEGLGYEVAFGVAHELGGGVNFGNAVLSRWPIASCTPIALPTGATDERRALVFAEIDSPHGKIPFFVTHLNWKLHHGIVRERQVVAIAGHVKAAAPIAGLPPVLVGDFNADPDSAEIRFLKGLQSLEGQSTYFADCFGLTGMGPGYTFDATRNPFAAITHEPPRRIDYVFVRGPDTAVRGKPLHARVVMEDVDGGVAATDHYGVYAEISI